MKPDAQWKDRDGSLSRAYRIMTVQDARTRGDTAAEVLARLAAVIDGLPAMAADKATYFTPWLEAVRHVYGPTATAAGMLRLRNGGPNGNP